MRSLWARPDFLKLWTGRTISGFGSEIGGTALQFTAILTLSAGPAQIGWLRAVEIGPVLVIGLVAGVWVDRLPRRPVMVITDLGRAGLLLSIPLAAAIGFLGIAQLYVVAGVTGALTVFFDVADQSFLPSLLPPEQLTEGNSKLGAGDSLAEVAGPAAGGGLVQILSGPTAILFDSISFLISALCVGAIQTSELRTAPREARENLWHEVRSGLHLVLHTPMLRALTASLASFELFGNFVGTLYMLYAVRQLHIAPSVVGMLIGLGGASALVGTFLATGAVRRFGAGRTLIGSLTVYGALSVVIPLAHGPVSVAIAFLAAGQVFGDAAISIFLINEISLRQAIVPGELLGRANATVQVLVGGAGLVGAIVVGNLAGSIGLRPTIAIGVAGIAMASLWMVFSPIRSLR